MAEKNKGPKKMKLAFLKLFNEVNWAGFAIDQALMMCDKLLIGEGSVFAAFPDIPKHSDDGTLDIISDKQKQHPKRIETFTLLRNHKNYRLNMCANYNYALAFCEIGDYFIPLDADDFFIDKWIVEANELMAENYKDLISIYSYNFAFGFKWRIEFNFIQNSRPIIMKKTKELHFIPTAKHAGAGKNQIVKSGVKRFHYMWVKPKARMLIRMQTSGRYPNMVDWFNKNWDRFELKDGKSYPSYRGEFTLRRYEREHPSILNTHPWRNVEDIRKLDCI